jgi:hypothetical protein
MLTVFAWYLKILASPARLGVDVSDYALNTFYIVPRREFHDIKNLLEDRDWFLMLATLQPAVNQYPEWFGTYRDLVLGMIDHADELTSLGKGDSIASHEDDNPESTSEKPDHAVSDP